MAEKRDRVVSINSGNRGDNGRLRGEGGGFLVRRRIMDDLVDVLVFKRVHCTIELSRIFLQI